MEIVIPDSAIMIDKFHLHILRTKQDGVVETKANIPFPEMESGMTVESFVLINKHSTKKLIDELIAASPEVQKLLNSFYDEGRQLFWAGADAFVDTALRSMHMFRTGSNICKDAHRENCFCYAWAFIRVTPATRSMELIIRTELVRKTLEMGERETVRTWATKQELQF